MSWRELTRSAEAVLRWWWVVMAGIFLTIMGAILDVSSNIEVPYWFWGYPLLAGLAIACFAALHSDRLRQSPHLKLRLDPTPSGQVDYVINILQVGGQIQPIIKMHCRLVNNGGKVRIVGLEGRWSERRRLPFGQRFECPIILRSARVAGSGTDLAVPFDRRLDSAFQTEVLTLQFDNLLARSSPLPVHSSFFIRMKVIGARDCEAHVADFRLEHRSIGPGAFPVNVPLIPDTSDFPIRVV